MQLDGPVPKRSSAYSPIHDHAEFIRSTIAANPHITTKELYAKLRLQGYQGKQTAAYTQLSRYMPRKVKVESTFNKSIRKYLTWRPAIVCLLIYKPYSSLNIHEKELLDYLRKESADIDTIYQFAQRFREMMERKDGSTLQSWIQEAINSPLRELRNFAKSLRLDFNAVYNATTSVYSNGPIEGHINKLKTIKRQMYGRASFELLKRRLVLQSHYDLQT